jgi:hypothetical protein
MPEDNSSGYHHRHWIDKGPAPIDHPARAHNDIFAPPVCGGPPMNPDPHGHGPKANPYVPASSRRPRDEPREMRPPHNPPPTPLARIIGPNAAAHMKNITPDATRAVREMIERKRQGQDGHARR